MPYINVPGQAPNMINEYLHCFLANIASWWLTYAFQYNKTWLLTMTKKKGFQNDVVSVLVI